MHLGIAECRVPFWVTVTADLDFFFNNRVRSISLIFFGLGNPNLVCECILVWWCVAYHFRLTVTLNSDLVFKIVVSGTYLLYYLR